MTERKKIIGVIGSSRATPEGLKLAEEVGRLIAEAGAVLVCGGLGGVMEAASKGCSAAGGEVIGILPGPAAEDANRHVTLAIPTNMGHARNVIIAHTAQAVIAIEGEYGTISETAISLKLGKKVFVLRPRHRIDGVTVAETASGAVEMALSALR